MRSGLLVGLLLAGVVASAQESAPVGRLSLAEYAAALDGIRAQLQASRAQEAGVSARELMRAEIAWGDDVLVPDATLLAQIAAAPDQAALRRSQVRLERLARELRAAAGGASASVPAVPSLLAGLAAPSDPARGGVVSQPQLRPLSLPARVGEALLAVWDRVAAWVRAVWDWLEKLLPARARRGGDAAGVARAAIAVVAVAIVALVLLAIRAARGRRGEPAPTSLPLPSSADEDPLSRETSEWERHAQELAAARRFREAIRAWYHAVLTALFRRGELHYRKGRTNWEYVASLSPQHGWRPRFIALTRLFDREWYGRHASEREALEECAHEAQRILQALHTRGAS